MNVPLLAYPRARGYLCPPVSEPHVFLCVLVCTWISMRVSTQGAGDLWGATLEGQRLMAQPCPLPSHLLWGPRQRKGAEKPYPSSRGLCACPRLVLGLVGESERLS